MQRAQLRVRRAANAIVIAPFAGVVTEINAEPGQSVGAQGVLELISGEPEIRLDVDESNLADLELEQTAIISSSTFQKSTFQGRVTEIGAAVEEERFVMSQKSRRLAGILPVILPTVIYGGVTILTMLKV